MNSQSPVVQTPSKQDVAWLGTDPIPASPYYDPEYFALEREAIFKRTWLPSGHICELPEPGCFIRREIEVANASILIIRGKDGNIRAFHNVCVHRGTRLVTADAGKQSSFSCRYHKWTYGPDGSLLSAPDFEAFFVEKSQCGLKPVAVEVFAGLIFVNLSEPRQSVREWFGALADEFERLPIAQATNFVEYSYEINANWKITLDNFQENYHLRFVHPRTGGSPSPENPLGYPSQYSFYGPHRSQNVWNGSRVGTPPKIQQLAHKRIMAAANRADLFKSSLNSDSISLFPNMTLFGLPIRLHTQTIMPLAPDRCRSVVRFYWVGDGENASERFAREYVMESQRDIHVEDRYIVEDVQRGLSSGALPSINYQVNESLCRHLFNTVDEMVCAYRAERASGVSR